VVTVEMKSGEMYRGKLVEAEDNMNMRLADITYTARDGRVAQLDAVYVRGSKVRFVVVPDMLRNAPMFQARDPKAPARGRGIGRGNRGVFRSGRARSRGGPRSQPIGSVPQAPRFPITK
jgi:small nuclear ribonucleoprotein D3